LIRQSNYLTIFFAKKQEKLMFSEGKAASICVSCPKEHHR
jgi:hypothetical protein